jgi:hypothetical protein
VHDAAEQQRGPRTATICTSATALTTPMMTIVIISSSALNPVSD